jgi:uncharacterized protein YxjI
MDDPSKIQAQVAKAGADAVGTGGGTLFTEPVLVVNQKAKIWEGSSSYAVKRADGMDLGAVRQVGQSAIGKFLKAASNLDAFMSARYEVVDTAGVVQLVIEKPRTFMKGRMIVQRGDGTEVGQIVQKIKLGKAKFLLTAPGGEQEIGSINAENFRAWNFAISDAAGNEVARISKTWAGLAKEMFTNADNYVVELKVQLADPLHSLVIASALTIDQLLKQFKS